MAADNEVEPKSKSKITRLMLLLEAFVTRPFPWLKSLIKLIPERFRPAVYLIVALVIAASSLQGFLQETTSHVCYWLHGPKVMITMLPHDKSDVQSFGDIDILNEFKFDPHKVKARLHLLHDSKDFKELLSSPGCAISIRPFTCDQPEQASRSTGNELYRLSLIAQNIGDSSPGEYELTITFNAAEAKYGDPGVRILRSDNDDLVTAYMYSQDSQETVDRDLPQCVKRKSDHQPPRPSYLVQKSYQNIGLTRELIILKGKLDPQLFQTINLLVTIPPTIEKFIMLYHVKCTNCSPLAPRDSWYGQVIRVVR